MSSWTYINGTIIVSPMGRTQAEKRYILDTVLEHLPNVTGSEGDMNIYIVQKTGHDCSSSVDEFGEKTNNLRDNDGDRSRTRGWLRTQSEYILVVEGSLRDRFFNRTYREFQKWLCRLAKRISVENVLVEITGYDEKCIITNPEISNYKHWDTVYGQMFEPPSWFFTNKDKEPNWCEYLIWQPMDECDYPAVLGYKYFNSPENDKKVETWIKHLNKAL